MAYVKLNLIDGETLIDKALLDHIQDGIIDLESTINYKAITASLSASVTSKEVGDSVSNVVLSWNVSKETSALTLDGVSMAGKTSHTDANTYTSNKTWTLSATEKTGKPGGTPVTATATARLSFFYRIWYGTAVEPSSYTGDFVKTFNNNSLQNSRVMSFDVNAGDGEYIYYCLPSGMGECTFTVGVLSGGFSKVANVSYTNGDRVTDYSIYRSNNPGLGAKTVKVS